MSRTGKVLMWIIVILLAIIIAKALFGGKMAVAPTGIEFAKPIEVLNPVSTKDATTTDEFARDLSKEMLDATSTSAEIK